MMVGFYSEVDQIVRDCEMKPMEVFGQILVLSNDVKNDLDINKYQKENNLKTKAAQIKYLQNNIFCSHIARWSPNGLEKADR